MDRSLIRKEESSIINQWTILAAGVEEEMKKCPCGGSNGISASVLPNFIAARRAEMPLMKVVDWFGAPSIHSWWIMR